MRILDFVERLLTKKRGHFLLAWTLSIELAMVWVILAYSGSPARKTDPSYAVLSFGGTIFIVAAVAAVAILGIAYWLEKFWEARRFGRLAASFGYLILFIVIGFSVFMLGFSTRSLSGGGYLAAIVGAAFSLSAPVAFAARLIYPSLMTRPKKAAWVIAVGLLLASFGLFSVIGLQLLPDAFATAD